MRDVAGSPRAWRPACAISDRDLTKAACQIGFSRWVTAARGGPGPWRDATRKSLSRSQCQGIQNLKLWTKSRATLSARHSRFFHAVRRFLTSEDGPTAVEYALMLALIVLIRITAIQSIGTNANTQFGKVATKLGS
jgi:pilus assembly protein Flp/PilA